jgi:hypothetical protein
MVGFLARLQARVPGTRPTLAVQEFAVVFSGLLDAYVKGRVLVGGGDEDSSANSGSNSTGAGSKANVRGLSDESVLHKNRLTCALILEMIVGLLKRRVGLRRQGRQVECPAFINAHVMIGLLQSVIVLTAEDSAGKSAGNSAGVAPQQRKTSDNSNKAGPNTANKQGTRGALLSEVEAHHHLDDGDRFLSRKMAELMREVMMLTPVKWLAPEVKGESEGLEKCVLWALKGMWVEKTGATAGPEDMTR